MKKICLLSHGLGSGGVESFIITLAKGLIADGYDVTIAMAVDPDGPPQFREAEAIAMGAKIYKTSDLDGKMKIIRHCKRLYRFLKDEKFDVFHANMDLFNGVNMLEAWLAGVPVRVCHSHKSQSQYEASTGNHFVVNVYRTIMRAFLWCFSNRRCGCSEMAMDYLFQGKWKKDVNSSVVCNGIDFSRFTYDGFDKAQKKQELALPENRILIAVGRFGEEKNPIFTIQVMKELHKLRPELHLIWIGDGGMRSQMESEIGEAGSAYIHLMGTKKNVNDYLRCADLFLMPSLFEGLPIAPIEAQAADLPCVLSDTITQQVNFGLCQFISLSESAATWAAAICDILDGKTILSIDEEKRVKFDQHYMVKSMEKIYG